MNQELAFAKALEELKDIAFLQNNVVSMDEVKETMGDFIQGDEQLEAIVAYLKQCKIGIDEAVNLDDYMSKEEKDYLAMYQEELNGLHEYSESETENIFINAMKGQEDDIQKVIELSLKEVVDIAKLYTAQGVYLEDLIGEGNMTLIVTAGMIQCCETVEEAKAMIAQGIMNSMETYIMEQTEITSEELKRNEQVNKVATAARELAKDLQKEVTIEELMNENGFEKEYIEEAMQYSGNSIEYIVGEEENDDSNE